MVVTTDARKSPYCERAAEAVEAGLGGFLESVLPDADDLPSPPAELAGHASVAGHVFLAFAVPECAVGFRAGVAPWTSVPEPSL